MDGKIKFAPKSSIKRVFDSKLTSLNKLLQFIIEYNSKILARNEYLWQYN